MNPPELGGLDIAPVGDAQDADAKHPYLALTRETPDSVGGVWVEQSFDLLTSKLTVHFEYSVELPEGAGDGNIGGGAQLLFQFGDRFGYLGNGGDSLGTGGSGGPRYLGVGLDIGTDEPFGPFGQHLEINQDGDPAQDATRVSTNRAPDVLGTGSAGTTVRYTVSLDRERIAVYASSDHDCFGGRKIIEFEYEVPEVSIFGGVAVGFVASSGSVPVVHRLHRLVIDSKSERPLFLRGDCNQDGVVCGSVTDMLSLVVACFQGGPPLLCEDACDANDDGVVCGSVTDVVFLANYCFLGAGNTPTAPFGECGADPSDDNATCETPSACGNGIDPESFVWLGENDSGFPEFLRLRDEMLMVEIPAGSFEQGDHFRDFGEDELPVHTTSITQSFLLGKFEVTVAQYRRFLAAIGCDDSDCADYNRKWDFDGLGSELYDGSHYPAGVTGPSFALNEFYFEDAAFAEHPVLWIDWFDAVAYSRWANNETSDDWNDHRVYGIPSEAEWEYAARFHGEGEEASRYPWGGNVGVPNHPDNINETLCNFGQVLGHTIEVCSLPAGRSFFGLYHQSGNVYEWTADWYDGDSYETAPRDDPFVAVGEGFRQLRGGGWFGAPFSERGAYRCNFEPEHPDSDVGTRSAARRRTR